MNNDIIQIIRIELFILLFFFLFIFLIERWQDRICQKKEIIQGEDLLEVAYVPILMQNGKIVCVPKIVKINNKTVSVSIFNFFSSDQPNYSCNKRYNADE